jgi:hypothetical protein
MIFSLVAGILNLLLFFIYVDGVYGSHANFNDYDILPFYMILALMVFSLVISLTAGLFVLLLRYEGIRKWVVVLTGVVYMILFLFFVFEHMDHLWSGWGSTVWSVPVVILLLVQLVPFFGQDEILVNL